MDIHLLPFGRQEDAGDPGVKVGLAPVFPMGTEVQQTAAAEQLGHHDMAVRMARCGQVVALGDSQRLGTNQHLRHFTFR